MDNVLACAKKYDTPFYLFDIPLLKDWCDEVKSVFSGASLCYAIKANPFLLPYMDKFIERFEVCSPGEYAICLKCGISSEKIVLSGVYKSKQNIETAFDNDFKGIITLESPNHFKFLKEVVKERSLSNVRIMPRLSSKNQFGMSRDDILAILSECNNMPEFELAGIQMFSGTQKKRINIIERELSEIDEFCDAIFEKTGNKVSLIEYGPGIFYDYYGDSNKIESAKAVNEALKPYTSKYEFSIETGRYISAPCGRYVTKIVDIKHTEGINYCIVDGGINHVNYYGRMLGMNVPDVEHVSVGDDSAEVFESAKGAGNDDASDGFDGVDGADVSGVFDGSGDSSFDKWTVCGALCTVNDVLLRNHNLCDPKEDDLLIFNDTGAYSCTEASALFLSRDMPRIIALEEDGSLKLLRDIVETHQFNCGV